MVQQIIRGLNSAGFSDRDYRLAEPIEPAKPAPVPEQLPMFEPETAQDDFAGLDGKSIWAKLQRRRESEKTPDSAPKADSMLAEARQAGDAYNQAVQGADNDPFAAVLPWEVRDKVNTFPIIPQYRGSVDGLLIPQFFQVIPQSLFTNGDKVHTPLKKCSLTADDGASPPLKWCTNSAEMVHGGRRRGARGRHAGNHSGMPLRLRMDSPSIWMV